MRIRLLPIVACVLAVIALLFCVVGIARAQGWPENNHPAVVNMAIYWSEPYCRTTDREDIARYWLEGHEAVSQAILTTFCPESAQELQSEYFEYVENWQTVSYLYGVSLGSLERFEDFYLYYVTEGKIRYSPESGTWTPENPITQWVCAWLPPLCGNID